VTGKNLLDTIMTTYLPWTLTAISIFAAVLNIKKKRASFAIYTLANIGWIAVNIYHEIYAQAVLFVVFTGLSTWGWIEWGKRKWKS